MSVVCNQVRMFVDGVNEKWTTMDYELVQPIICHESSSLFVGHARSVSQQLSHALHYQLGNIFLINGYAFSLYFASSYVPCVTSYLFLITFPFNLFIHLSVLHCCARCQLGDSLRLFLK